MSFQFKNILITGANGQLGYSFQKAFADLLNNHRDLKIYAFGKSDLDITNSAMVSSFFQKNQIDLCINCAAYTKVDQAETEAELAHQSNAVAPGILARECQNAGATMIHFSSDYVYDNGQNSPLKETDRTEPKSVYAKSKLEGEIVVSRLLDQYYIFRTSWLYGTKGHNFIKTMLRLGEAGKDLSIVGDQIGTPTFTDDLAFDILNILTIMDDKEEKHYGTYNYSNAGVTNWYEYAKYIFQIASLDVNISSTTTVAYGAAASRPLYSVLSNEKLMQNFHCTPRNWKLAVKDCMRQLEKTT